MSFPPLSVDPDEIREMSVPPLSVESDKITEKMNEPSRSSGRTLSKVCSRPSFSSVTLTHQQLMTLFLLPLCFSRWNVLVSFRVTLLCLLWLFLWYLPCWMPMNAILMESLMETFESQTLISLVQEKLICRWIWLSTHGYNPVCIQWKSMRLIAFRILIPLQNVIWKCSKPKQCYRWLSSPNHCSLLGMVVRLVVMMIPFTQWMVGLLSLMSTLSIWEWCWQVILWTLPRTIPTPSLQNVP